MEGPSPALLPLSPPPGSTKYLLARPPSCRHLCPSPPPAPAVGLHSNTADWWYNQTPAVFRMLSHSDLYKPGAQPRGRRALETRRRSCAQRGPRPCSGRALAPALLCSRIPSPLPPRPLSRPCTVTLAILPLPDKTMMATKGITVVDFDAGTCTASGCTGNSLFRCAAGMGSPAAARGALGTSFHCEWQGVPHMPTTHTYTHPPYRERWQPVAISRSGIGLGH
jgi:hypothetical protein